METPGNKYLHKKFKKQMGHPPHGDESVADHSARPRRRTGAPDDADAPAENGPAAFGDDGVPNHKSTNRPAVPGRYGPRRAADAGATPKRDNQSSISNPNAREDVVDRGDDDHRDHDIVLDRLATSTTCSGRRPGATPDETNCISSPACPVDSTPAAVGADSKENRLENSNFDTRINFSGRDATDVDKSSILDAARSKIGPAPPDTPNATVAVLVRADSDCAGDKKQVASVEPAGGKYVCTYCNLACSKPSVLQKHVRAHTNERPYPCVSCGFSFKTRSNLYKHCRSRTHTNRVMGNKHVHVESCDGTDRSENKTDRDTDDNIGQRSEKSPPVEPHSFDVGAKPDRPKPLDCQPPVAEPRSSWEQRSKPYKPKFHTAKMFFEENKQKESGTPLRNVTAVHDSDSPSSDDTRTKPECRDVRQKSGSDDLKMRINNLISKNNSIINCDDAVVIRRKYLDCSLTTGTPDTDRGALPHQTYWQSESKTTDEPLNLTSKNRKRCLSDSDNVQKSLIKELLLKNLSADPNLQCQHCRMIFQTVTELEMHKFKYCDANSKNNHVRYARSSSVNVASVLTHNRNVLDDAPTKSSCALSLKSPGPFLGKTRLIENDKQHRAFSFDDNGIRSQLQPKSPSLSKYMMHSPNYPLSPQLKKNPVRLFGGEVKITQTSGETRSFKIESENISKMSEEPQNYINFDTKLSENLVIKSTLQSGGTVLQNKTNYSAKMERLPSPNLIRVYDSNEVVPTSLKLSNKISYEKTSHGNMQDKYFIDNEPLSKRGVSLTRNRPEISDGNLNPGQTEEKEFKTNMLDFGQKAVKLLAPNLKHPNLMIPGLPVPGMNFELLSSPTFTVTSAALEFGNELEKLPADNINFIKRQSNLPQKTSETSHPPMFNPVNLLVNGKVVRYVPGIPGPIADTPDVGFNSVVSTGRLTAMSRLDRDDTQSLGVMHNAEDEKSSNIENPSSVQQYERNTPTITIDHHESRQFSETNLLACVKKYKNNQDEQTSIALTKPAEVSPTTSNKLETKLINPPNLTISIPDKLNKEGSRKFARPNTLPLKPNSVSFKSHHGLTPTMFNQALISPDTPRVAKKYCQQYLNGNYFSYLGLKSSTKPVYCTLNKTQPFYVMHFKKLSMYSEWRQQESKIDSLSIGAYDSRQQQQKYTMAGQAKADLIAHSSYKFVTSDNSSSKEDLRNKNSAVLGGYESNEDYTYIRGRGRGRYVCDQCGIRCKKPSMLKKHIRTHSDDRPYTCQHCNFSFKTKGNLTKHMKSKAHSKKYAETSSTSTQNSVTTSSDSDDSDAESSDESTRLQEHEAAHCLLSLAQKNHSPSIGLETSLGSYSNSTGTNLNLSDLSFFRDDRFLKNSEQINQVNSTNFVKNKFLDENNVMFAAKQHITDVVESNSNSSQETNNVSQYLGKSSAIRPLTYPYLQSQVDSESKHSKNESADESMLDDRSNHSVDREVYGSMLEMQPRQSVVRSTENRREVANEHRNRRTSEETQSTSVVINPQINIPTQKHELVLQNMEGNIPTNIVFRKRKLLPPTDPPYKAQRTVGHGFKAMDLSVPIEESPVLDLSPAALHTENTSFNCSFARKEEYENAINIQVNKSNYAHKAYIMNVDHTNLNKIDSNIMPSETYDDRTSDPSKYNMCQKSRHGSFSESNSSETFSQTSELNERFVPKPSEMHDSVCSTENPNVTYKASRPESKALNYGEQDQSAMQTLAEIATKQVKLEKNTLAKSVATEYLKLALKTEYNSNCDISNSEHPVKKFVSTSKETVNEMMVKPEENKNCSICSKNFSKPSQLRLHMNIHYLERPFRCESCSVSFRTKGHLQKHERSASHHNKLSSSPAMSSSEPRPFKCSDCNIAFRIHGHLAKHLRSKMHIMKLECLAKIPFGLYAELEKANSLLTEINTTDGEMCLESLKILARKLFSNDPNKLDQLANNTNDNRDS